VGKVRVAVVYGGRSSEHGISVVSAGSVMNALDKEKYEIVPIGIAPSGQWMLTDADPARMSIVEREVPEVTDGTPVVFAPDPSTRRLSGEQSSPVETIGSELDGIDVVFPVLHGRFGEDGTIQGLFEMAGVPYVGAGVFASAAAMDKEMTKKLLAASGLAVGEYVVVRGRNRVSVADVAHLGLPVFVKPSRAGSSVGITKVTEWSQLEDAVELAFEHDNKVLIEAGVVGREVECGVLEGEDGEPQASLPAEIRLVRGHDWYDFEAKYLDDACEFDVPAKLSPELTAAVQESAKNAFTALDCSGLARVDFFVTESGEVIVNEVNTMPGFTPISMYPRMWAASGVDYPELLDRLIQAALRR
jgi:D-alanine-D-alanine ligase